PDLLGAEGGARLYRTGDRVRWRADGNLEFLGRRDRQVKVRGYRIEPAEIEAVMFDHIGVGQCAVILSERAFGQQQLIGFYVAGVQPAPSANELRDYLKTRLPGYMVPGVVVELAELPLTANGKVDRQALEGLERGGGRKKGKREARSAVEEIVQGIWEEVLGREEIGVEENFFEVGGHSLLATQVMSRIRAAFGVELPLRALFERATILELS